MNLASIIGKRVFPLLLPIVMGASGCAPQTRWVGNCGVKDFSHLGSEEITASTQEGLINICSKMFTFSSFRDQTRILTIGRDTIEIPPPTLDVQS